MHGKSLATQNRSGRNPYAARNVDIDEYLALRDGAFGLLKSGSAGEKSSFVIYEVHDSLVPVFGVCCISASAGLGQAGTDHCGFIHDSRDV